MGIRLLLAALLGGVIGINRGRLEWAAGLRTHMLVCVGSSLAVIVSAYGFSEVLGQPNVTLDPSRIAAQVISGVGFLGAGTILFLQREQVIRGLTTAAGLWAVASIGLAAGAGLYAAASMATALLWAILALLKPLEQRYLRHASGNGLRVTLARGSSLARLESAIADFHLPVRRISLKRRDDSEDLIEIYCDQQLPRARLLEVADQLAGVEGITSVGMLAPPDHS
ncbi:MAG: MgtC/SapB family protein [Stenotrophomonas sp.]